MYTKVAKVGEIVEIGIAAVVGKVDLALVVRYIVTEVTVALLAIAVVVIPEEKY